MMLFLYTFSASMSRFDTGAPPSDAERLAESVFRAFCQPILSLAFAGQLGVSGPAVWLVSAVNSLLWAIAFWLLLRAFRWLRSSQIPR